MRKPVLLVVDDDAAVLEAVVNELTLAFGDLCKVVAFEVPEQVLEALPQWSAEERRLALAIVDQKMPGMTGTELLGRLREQGAAGARFEHILAHMRAILLTGHAGLESALESKNNARVDRYLEKPWQGTELARQVRQLLRAFHSGAGTANYMEFRELVTAEELRAQFKMRYEVYSQTPDLQWLMKPNRSKLATDNYDLISRHLALVQITTETQAQVGGLRIIGVESPAVEAILRIAQEDPALREALAAPRVHVIELPGRCKDTAVVVDFITNCQQRGEAIVELGRLVLSPVARGSARSAHSAAATMLDGTAARVGFSLLIENTLLQCKSSHSGAYGFYGFQRMPGVAPSWSEGAQESYVVLWARPEWVPHPARDRVLAMAAAWQREGRACRCAEFPRCCGGPYETGDFSAADIACPKLALARTSPPSSIPTREPTGAEFEE